MWEMAGTDSTLLADARGVGVCPTDSNVRYIGTLAETFAWSSDENLWQMEPDGPTNVRDFIFNPDSCDVVYAAALDEGVWQKNAGKWKLLGEAGALSGVRAVALRNNELFAGTAAGLRSTGDWSNPEEVVWQDAVLPGLISDLNLVGERLFAAVWTMGERHNDTSNEPDDWSAATAPDGDTLVVKVLGYPDEAADSPEPWLMATTSGIYVWDSAMGVWQATNVTNQLVYSLLSYTYESGCASRNLAFAGLSEGGVMVSYDEGLSWQRLGRLADKDGNLLTVFDMTVTNDGELFVTTPNDGVWTWTMPASICPTPVPTPSPTPVPERLRSP